MTPEQTAALLKLPVEYHHGPEEVFDTDPHPCGELRYMRGPHLITGVPVWYTVVVLRV